MGVDSSIFVLSLKQHMSVSAYDVCLYLKIYIDKTCFEAVRFYFAKYNVNFYS